MRIGIPGLPTRDSVAPELVHLPDHFSQQTPLHLLQAFDTFKILKDRLQALLLSRGTGFSGFLPSRSDR